MTAWIALSWAITSISVAGLAGTFAWMRLRSRGTSEADGFSGGISGFSMERYQPMEKLLADADYVYLTQMPGYRASMGARWKRERRRIFRLYLNELTSDFEQLHATARQMVADTNVQDPAFVKMLVQQKVQFWQAMAVIDMRLTIDSVKIGSIGIGKVNPRPLLDLLESMRMDLSRFTPAAAAAGA